MTTLSKVQKAKKKEFEIFIQISDVFEYLVWLYNVYLPQRHLISSINIYYFYLTSIIKNKCNSNLVNSYAIVIMYS